MSLQNYNFFQNIYPNSKFVEKNDIAKYLTQTLNNDSFFLELGVGSGSNIKTFKQLNYQGKMVCFDKWDRFLKPVLSDIEMIEGDVYDTLSKYNWDKKIDILYMDLDQDFNVTKYALDYLIGNLSNSYIYFDEFLVVPNIIEDSRDTLVFAKWLTYSNYKFNILFYTEFGALIKLGEGHDSYDLLLNLEKFCEEFKKHG